MRIPALVSLLAVLTTISITPTNSENSAIFTAISSKAIFPHSLYNVTVTVEEGGGPTLFTASISSSGKSYFAQEVEINAGMSNTLSLEVNDLPEDTYNLTIKSDTSGAKFEDTTVIFVERKERSIFIQTDKPIYKPGETVRFRVVVLNRFFKTFQEPQEVNIKVLDPSQNVIKLWYKQQIQHGLCSQKLGLSAEPNLGDWTIEVVSTDKTETQRFTVAQYVLPKFKVDVKLPSFITYNSSKIRAEIKASYTYGKGLKGDCTVTLSRKGYYYQPYGELRKIVERHTPIDGSATMEFESVRDELGLQIDSTYFQEIEFEVVATVKDALTGREQNGSSSLKMYKFPYKIEYVDQATSYQPGLPFIMKFKVATQDNVPIEDASPNALTVSHGFSYHAEGSISKSPIPSNGIVAFTFITPSNEYISVSNVQVTYKEFTQTFYLPQRSQSASKIYVQLSIVNAKVKAGDEMDLTLRATKEFPSFNYVVYGRGVILESKVIALSTPAKEHTFKVIALAEAAPEGQLIVYLVFPPKNEIVAHSISFSMSSVLTNKLDLKLSAETLEPGHNLTISIKTMKNSLVALRGVDQSVLLLKDDKDINTARIDGELKEMETSRNSRNRIWGGSGSFQVFEQAGLSIITNGFIEKAVYHPIWHQRRFFGGGGGFGMNRMKMAPIMEMDMARGDAMDEAMPVMMKARTASSFRGGAPQQEIRIRKSFPETWIWEELWLGKMNSSTTIHKTVPDTLTSWIIAGYSLNSEAGIGLSLEPLTLKTFRPFFISLNLPYSVVKGEILSLQVLVHNYQSEEVSAWVELNNEGGKFELSGKNPSLKKEVKVGAAQVASLTFAITPKSFGIIMINMKAGTANAGDGLSQPLTVKPPGHKQTKNLAVLIDLRSGASVKQKITATFPDKRVKGADAVKITIIADLLGTSISNLDNLLQMPCGCGEQNMLGFVPDIVILDYLTATQRLTPAIKSKALKFLESGYQRELTYRHYDGSFSAFGNSDPIGSTWLTAFVVRSFSAAKPYITIDENIVTQSLEYLSNRQTTDGSFQELGRVLHSDMQGGSSNTGLALTAYTLLAFIEASKNSSKEIEAKYAKQIAKGLEYITKESTEAVHSKSDMYSLVLIAYTLELAKHSRRDTYFKLLKEAGKSSGDLMHWEMKESSDSSTSEGHHKNPWERSSSVRPVSVEMTSYALMVYLERKNIEESLPIVRWLLKQRNAEGGFLSTQDTVVGLTALSKFAALISGPDTNLKVSAKYEGGSKEAHVTTQNAIVLQEFKLPKKTREVEFSATGKGTALVQLTWSYYIEDKSPRPAFTLNVEAEAMGTKLKLKICASYLAGESSNMAVVEVNVPSGFLFDREELSELKTIPKMKRYDLEDGDSKLVIYFENLDKGKTCMDVSAMRVFSVDKQAAAYVIIKDYYDTTKYARTFYDAPKVESTCAGNKNSRENCVDGA